MSSAIIDADISNGRANLGNESSFTALMQSAFTRMIRL